jgi:hypothetical protein
MDQLGEVSVPDGSPLKALLQSLPEPPAPLKGRPILALYAAPLAQPAATAAEREKLIEEMVAGTAPMSKWVASVDYSTYAGFVQYLETQLREVLYLKTALDPKRDTDHKTEALASFVDGRSASLEAALGTFRVVLERESALRPPLTQPEAGK